MRLPSCIKVEAIDTAFDPAGADSLKPAKMEPLEVSIVVSSVRITIDAFSFPAEPESTKLPNSSVRTDGSVNGSNSPSSS